MRNKRELNTNSIGWHMKSIPDLTLNVPKLLYSQHFNINLVTVYSTTQAHEESVTMEPKIVVN